MAIPIIPSIAAAPLTNLSSLIPTLEAVGVDTLHFDIEDGNFVPMMTLGTKIIQELRTITKMNFDVHLMINNPEWLIPELYNMGVNAVSIHYEACLYPRRVLKIISQYHMEAGLAFNPATPIPELDFCLPYLSFILVLTTEPETDTYIHLSSVLNKIRLGKQNPALQNLCWVVDGGVDKENICHVIEAGADKVIVGRAMFKDNKLRENFQDLQKAALGVRQ